MSHRVFFSLSMGLARNQVVPRGTLQALQEHVAWVERELKIELENYRGEMRWRRPENVAGEGVSDETFCKVATEHNTWVRWLYKAFEEWSEARRQGTSPVGVWERERWGGRAWRLVTFGHKTFPKPERLTPKQARTFWRALHEIDVPPSRWTRKYFVARMEHLYEVMRGRESEGVTLDAKKPLSARQAAAVVGLFSEYLDGHDMRLDVPNGHDHLASSYDGGYNWCEKCGPMHPDDVGGCRRKACPLLAERDENDGDDRARRWVVKDKAAGVYLGRTPDVWPPKITRQAMRFTHRAEAEAAAKRFPKRTLVVVPVRGQR